MRHHSFLNLGWYVILALSFFPTLFWAIEPSRLHFSDPVTTLASIGQVLALVGTSMFALNLILSARLHFLEKYFGGLNTLYIKHNQLGQWAFILLLFHPLFLVPKYSTDFSQAASFLFLSSNWARNWGWLALVLMIVLISLTLYLRPKYNLWKLTHKFLGLAFFLAALHVFLIPSDVSIYLPLRMYILGLSFLGLLGFTYRKLLWGILVKKYKYRVTKVIRLAENVVEVRMVPEGPKLEFTPGQFVFVSFSGPGVDSESHPFSICSDPRSDELVLCAKKLGDYTSRLDSLSVGSKANLEGAFGVFSYLNSKYKNQIWIGGGIGITPFLSMAKSLVGTTEYSVDLYYCVRNPTEAIFLEELKDAAPSLRVIPFFSGTQGYLDSDVVERMSGGLDHKDIFICTPVGMVRSLKKQLISKKVDKNLIHSEEFDLT